MTISQISKVLFERDGKVGIIKLNRPEVLNCLDPETLKQLRIHLEAVQAEKRIHTLLICGEGRAFSTGMDLKYAKGKDPKTLQNVNRQGLVETLSYLQNFPKPTIAVIDGFALGGGFELALSCDFRFASKENAVFGFPEIDLGILPTWGGLFLPIDLLGISRAMELVLTGKRINADTAYTMGLVTRVVPHEQLFAEALAFAKNLARKTLFLLQLAKYTMRRSMQANHMERLKLTTLAAELTLSGSEGEKRFQSLLNET
ncbi:MAG: enoyl-CoA hydratase/isomerase family protein [Candidatus Helarchaeota archaeon]